MKARQLTKRDNKIIFYYDHPADTVIKTDFSQKMSWAGFVSKKEDFFERIWFIAYESEDRKKISEARAREIAPHLFLDSKEKI